jgi:hypothetical protein
LSPRYTATHAKSTLPRNANLPSRKRLKLVAATALAAAGIGAVTTSVGTSHWSNAVSNIAQKHSTGSTASAGPVYLDAYVPGPEIGIAGTLEYGAPANASATAFGHIATAQSAGTTTRSSATPAHAPAAQAPAPHAAAAAVPAHATAAPAHAAAAPAHAAPAPAHVAAAPAHVAAHTTAARAHAAPAHPAAPAAPAKPYLIYDSVTPSSIPAGQAAATYVNGAYAASASSVARHGHVLWIDTNGSDPTGANALDVEPGDATPAGAAQWVWTKMRADHGATAIVYTMISDWASVKANIGTLPAWQQAHVRYWIADPTGVPHVLPGSSATQWYWGNNYDITTANPGFQG